MCPFAFSLLLADALSTFKTECHYLFSIFAIHGFKDLCDISFLSFSGIIMAFSLPDFQYLSSVTICFRENNSSLFHI